ncbi:MAG: lytic transglycosylase domain-containing protein [Pseudomonadota bacterium]
MIPRLVKTALLAGIVAAGMAGPMAASQPQQLAAALQAVAQKNYDQATALAARTGDRVSVDIVAWHRLRAGRGSWPEYADFLTGNADWPGLPLMRRQAERVMPAQLPGDQVRAFFARTKPQTGRGALIYAGALGSGDAGAERRRAWTDLTLTRSERQNFLSRFGGELAGAHVARLDNLLWNGEREAAAEMLPLVGAGDAALARARIALQARQSGVDGLVAAVPAAQAGDPGLAYDRFRWRLAKDLWDGAEQMLAQRSTSAAALGRPEKWASNRRSIARRAMRQGRADTAYRLSSQHGLSAGSSYADLEWLSGYLALRYMNDPARAVAHFKRFQAAVETPISLGRAGYWLGRAYDAAGNVSAAREAYGYGARFQTSFYGQLAAERIGAAVDRSLARPAGVPGWKNQGFARATPVIAALRLQAAGDTQLALRFLLHVEESLGPQEGAALARLSMEMGQTAGAIKISKRVVRKGAVYPEIYYPVTPLAREAQAVPPELAMAVARQESELNPRAVSPAGARGLMQLMPRTAQKVSQQLGMQYSASRLITDPSYNGRLGTQYLADMLARYRGSVLLAAAAYNAGPGRVDRWLQTYGDPRRADLDAVDWIEHMPFRETRNYVMRVMESQHVYRARITGQVQDIGLSRALGL